MTEEEAKTKSCCGAGGQEVFGGNLGDLYCIGSQCMAWRWIAGDPHGPATDGGILLPRSQWPGFCGLAGKP